MYDELHARLTQPPRRLTAFERGVIAQAAAREAMATEPDLPFRLRPGLVAEILRFYDLLRRQSQQVQRFERGRPSLEDIFLRLVGADSAQKATAE